jgi:hypothetical protein
MRAINSKIKCRDLNNLKSLFRVTAYNCNFYVSTSYITNRSNTQYLRLKSNYLLEKLNKDIGINFCDIDTEFYLYQLISLNIIKLKVNLFLYLLLN